MYHTMTDGINLLVVLDTAIGIICQYTQNKLNTLLMARDLLVQDHLLAIFVSQFQERVGQTDFLDTTLCHDMAGSHIKQFVLNRTATAVEH